jgi:hypothetical protein
MLALAACWTGEVPPPAPPAAASAPQPADDRSVLLERTPCFGMCPAYQVVVSGNGIVQWHGESNVAIVGNRTSRIARARFAQIDAMIDRIGFFDYDEYGEKPHPMACTQQGNSTTCSWQSFTLCSDTSHVVITVRRKGVKHRVDDARCGESQIDDLGKLIDKLANTERWIRGE